MYVDVDPLTDAPPDPRTPPEAGQEVAALYETHALGLVKLAKIMLGDQAAAEDIVQDAFLGLYRKWPSLEDQDRALAYLRAGRPREAIRRLEQSEVAGSDWDGRVTNWLSLALAPRALGHDAEARRWSGRAVAMLDHNPHLRALAAQLMGDATILAGDVGGAKPSSDLVAANYVLAEFSEKRGADVAVDLWAAAGRMLTHAQSRRSTKARPAASASTMDGYVV